MDRAITPAGGSTHSQRESSAEASTTCFSGGARACTRSVASLTSKRSTPHRLSPADSRKFGSSGDDRSGERSRDRSTDRSRERSRGSCSWGRRQIPGRQDPMFVGRRAGYRPPPRPAGDSGSRRDPGASLIPRAEQGREPPRQSRFPENPHRNPVAWCQGSDPSAAFVRR